MRLAVAGGTGVVGRHVVEVARQRGQDAVVLARATGVDLTTGDGLAARLPGVEAVVDTTSTRAQKRARAEAFFGGVTRHLLDAEEAAGVGHHVALSIIGIDKVSLGYYQGKRLQERLIAEGVCRGASCGRRSSTSSPSRCCTSSGSGRSRWCRGC